jgi:hypothetical protein
MQDGTYTRMCRSRLAVNQLTESGRRTGRMAQVASGMVLLAAEPGHPEAFLPLPDPKLAPDGQACGEAAEGDAQTPGEGFPEGCGAIAEGNAVCREVIRAGEERWQAHIGWGEDKACGVMADGNGNLARHMRLVGACVTAMRIVLDDAAAWERAAWRLAQAGFVRLAATAGTPMHRAVLVRTWNGPDRVRFDAQVCDGAGEVVLTLHHMEFIRQTCDGADQADGKAD